MGSIILITESLRSLNLLVFEPAILLYFIVALRLVALRSCGVLVCERSDSVLLRAAFKLIVV